MQCCIKIREEIDAQQWDAHVMRTTGNPTQLSGYFIPRSHALPVFVQIEADGKTVFQWGLWVQGLPGIFCFVCASSEPSNSSYQYMNAATQAICRRYRPFRFDFYDLAVSRFSDEAVLKKLGFSPIFTYQANRVDLRQTEEEIFSGIHSKHRNVIRKAERMAVSVVEGNQDDLDAYYRLSEETYRRSQGNNVSKEVFMQAFHDWHKKGLLRLFFSIHQGEIQAAACIITSGYEAFYWKGATKTGEVTGASNLLHWEIIKILKRDGLHIYDLSGNPEVIEKGSKIEGIVRFKHRFGGTVGTYYGGEMICRPILNMLYHLQKRLRR